MLLALLLNAVKAVGAIAEVLPLLYLIMILGPILYALTIFFLIGRKHTVWRIAGWIFAISFFTLGMYIIQQPVNGWGIFNALFFVPVLIGLFSEYRLQRSLSA